MLTQGLCNRRCHEENITLSMIISAHVDHRDSLGDRLLARVQGAGPLWRNRQKIDRINSLAMPLLSVLLIPSPEDLNRPGGFWLGGLSHAICDQVEWLSLPPSANVGQSQWHQSVRPTSGMHPSCIGLSLSQPNHDGVACVRAGSRRLFRQVRWNRYGSSPTPVSDVLARMHVPPTMF